MEAEGGHNLPRASQSERASLAADTEGTWLGEASWACMSALPCVPGRVTSPLYHKDRNIGPLELLWGLSPERSIPLSLSDPQTRAPSAALRLPHSFMWMECPLGESQILYTIIF